MGLLSGLFGNKIGYGPQPGGVTGGYGGMLNGGMNTGPMGSISDLLTGFGVGLLSQGPSSTPISPLAGVGQGLQFANQLGQQRRATGQQQFQNQLLSQDAQRQQQAFELEKLKGTREQQQYDLQQQHLKSYADTITDPQQRAAFMADPAAYIKNVMPSPSMDIQNYNFYTKQSQAAGQQPLPFNDWQLQQKRATANMTTLNMPPQESEFQKNYGGQAGKDAASLVGATAGQAQDNLNNVAALKSAVWALQAAGGDTGKLAPLKQKATELIQAFGMDPTAIGLPADAGPAETITAITNKLAMQARSTANGAGLSGATSDTDREFLTSSVPGLPDTPLGLQMKADIIERVNKRELEGVKMWQSSPQTQQGWLQFKSDWIKYNNAHPVFGENDRQRATNLAQQDQVAAPGTPVSPIVTPQLPSGFQ